MKITFLTCFLLLLFSVISFAEIKYVLGGKLVGLNTSKAVDVEIHLTKRNIKKYCLGANKIDTSLEDLISYKSFPIANDKYPASDFVSGFLTVKSVSRSLGFYPKAYVLIWQNIVGDGDKAFNEIERNNVVALWSYTK